jgi:hypothetical protein
MSGAQLGILCFISFLLGIFTMELLMTTLIASRKKKIKENVRKIVDNYNKYFDDKDNER